MTLALQRPLHRVFRLVIPALLIVMFAVPMLPSVDAQGSAQTHTVQSGENLFRIALRYNLTVEALAAANGITDPARIYAGQVLTIPGETGAVAIVDNPAAAALSIQEPAPAASDPAPAAVPAPVGAPVYHTVQAGETLAAIGRAYGVGWADIATLNGLGDANQIFAGQQLIIPGTSAPGASAAVAPAVAVNVAPAANAPAPAQAAPAPAAAPASGERTHVVQPGEHLASVANQYGLSWPTIARANDLVDPNAIYSGQTLIIPWQDDDQGLYSPPTWQQPAASPPTITTGKQIVVDLGDQRTYAYENGQLLRTVTVSTGLAGTPTVTGDYNIYLKYDAQLMSGPGYYLPGVPYVMYFYQGYSLHGTYWHNNFGQPMSHGCVNMPTPEAQWFYNWAEIGTPVHVQW